MNMMEDDFPVTLERESSHISGNGTPVNLPTDVPPVAVAFGVHYEMDAVKSADAGHPVYRDVIFVKIAVPGDKNSLYFQPMQDVHKRRFPKAWANFEARQKGAEGRTGMPIQEWAPITRGMALTLKAMHIHTVEDLAAVHDGHIERLGHDGRTLRAKAQAFISQAEGSAVTNKLAAEKEELQGQLRAMQEQIKALQELKAGDTAKTETTPASAENDALKKQLDAMQRQMDAILKGGVPQQQVEADVAPEVAAARKPRGFQKRREDA